MKSQKLELEFRGEGAAGWGSEKNPQFFISAGVSTKATITLKCDKADALCFFVNKASNNKHRKRIFDFGDEDSPARIHTSAFVSSKELTEDVLFATPGAYVVLVMTNETNIEGRCSLEVCGQHVELTGGAEFKPTRIATAFPADSAYSSPKNPQILLSVSQPCSLGLAFSCPGATAVCFVVQKTDKGAAKRLMSFPDGAPSRVFSSSYSAAAEVSGCIEDIAPGDYIILLSQQEKGKQSKCTLSVESDTQSSFALAELSSNQKSKTLQFTADCGGYGSPRNPQFFLTISKACDVMIEMKCETKVDAVRFFVNKAAGSGAGGIKRLNEFGDEKAPERVFTSSYFTAQSVSGSVASLPAGYYVVLPMTRMNTPGNVTLSVEADDPSFQLDGANFELPQKLGEPSAFDAARRSKPTICVDVSGSKCDTMYDWADAKAVVDAMNAEHRKNPARYFADPSMPHDDRSINSPEAKPIVETQGAQWHRISYFAPGTGADAAQLFVSDDENKLDAANDVAQSAYCADCWLIAVISAVATRADITGKIFYPNTYNREAGCYAVRLMIDGTPRGLLIDDSLPEDKQHPAKLLFARSLTHNEFWSALLEKAFASFCGGAYNMLAGGNSSRGVGIIAALEMLTGGVGHYLYPSKAPTTWFAELKTILDKNWIASTQTKEAPGGGGGGGTAHGKLDKDTSLVLHHAYSILGAVEARGSDGTMCQMLQLRNTWSKGGEWSGKWSDGDVETWKANPEVAKACGMTMTTKKAVSSTMQDGCFWIEKADFELHFPNISVLRLISDEYPHSATLDCGPMSIESEGSNILAYRQFLLTSSKPGATINIRVMFLSKCKSSIRLVTTTTSSGASAAAAASAAIPVFLETKESDPSSGTEITTYVYDSVMKTQTLAASQRSLVIVPQLHPKQKEMAEAIPFRIIVDSSDPCSVQELPRARVSAVKHAFLVPCSYQSDDNPRVQLTLKGLSCLVLRLEAEDRDDKQGLKLVLAKATDDTLKNWPAATVAETKYLSASEVELSAALLPAGEYVAWATLQRPTKRNFVLKCMSQAEVTMTPL